VFDEVWRVLADDGPVWVNLGDSYANGGMSNPSKKSTLGGGKDRGASEYVIDRKIPKGLKPKDLVGIPWMFAFAMQDRGWYLRQDIIWAKPNPMPESVTDRCTKSHEYVFLLSKQPKYFFDNKAIREPATTKPTMRDRSKENYQNSVPGGRFGEGERMSGSDDLMKNKRSVWTVSTNGYKEAHFAVYPPALIEPCILAGSAEGDTVLDPFSGSGTTGEVALKNGRNYVGIELNPDYAALSEKRINNAIGMLGEVRVESC